MYKSISEISKKELRKLQKNFKKMDMDFREIEPKDFNKNNDNTFFTKENLISEIGKIDSFPDYTILITEWGDVHLVFYGQNSLTEAQNQKVSKIFEEFFGIKTYF